MSSFLTRSKINESESKNSENIVRLLNKYRVRIIRSSELPLFENSKWFCDQNPEVVVVDMPLIKNEELELQSGLEFDDDEEMDYENDDDQDGPLQISFLTLDKLNQGNNLKDFISLTPDVLCARASGVAKMFETKPIPTPEAATLRRIMHTQCSTLLEPVLSQMPIFVVSEMDAMGSNLLGVQKTKKMLCLHHTRCLGSTNDETINILSLLRTRFQKMSSKSQATTLYEVISSFNKKKRDVVSGRLSIVFHWKATSSSILEAPPPDSVGVFRFAPGWRDERVALNTTGIELDYLMNMVDALSVGDLSKIKWRRATEANTDAKIIESVNKVIDYCRGVSGKEIDEAGENRYLDMTEQLWCVLRACSSYEQLVLGLKKVFNMLTMGMANAVVHEDNRTMLARMVRDANSGDLMLPRLEALTPIQLFTEIAAEKIKRDLSYTFVHQGFLSDESQVVNFILCNTKATAPVEERAKGLIPVHLALQTIVEVSKHLQMDNFRLANMTRSVLLQYTRHPVDKMKEVVFETDVKKIDVNPDVIKNIRPIVWLNETWYNLGARSVYTMSHFTLHPRIEQMENKAIGGEMEQGVETEPEVKRAKVETNPNEAYVCTLTTSTFHEKNQLITW